MNLIITAIRNPRWFLAVLKVAGELIAGKHNRQSRENALKAAARKYNVDYHRFR